jgi:drug/metabolite transporter (DMT)-like permease
MIYRLAMTHSEPTSVRLQRHTAVAYVFLLRWRVMGTRTIAVLVTIAFSVIGVLGDYFLKLASAREQPLRTGWFYLGFALYASTAFGWVFVMRHLKLATISVLYSVSLVLLLTAIGVVLFRESLNYFEVIGIVLAVVSLVLLMRFA